MEDRLYMEIGKLIRKAREYSDKTQQELSEMVNLTRASIANIERGKQKVSIYNIYIIANALEVSPPSLMPNPSFLKESETLGNDLITEDLTDAELEWIEKLRTKSRNDKGGE